MAFIADRVAQARAGTNPYVIARLASGYSEQDHGHIVHAIRGLMQSEA